jgi:hypothetical protein
MDKFFLEWKKLFENAIKSAGHNWSEERILRYKTNAGNFKQKLDNFVETNADTALTYEKVINNFYKQYKELSDLLTEVKNTKSDAEAEPEEEQEKEDRYSEPEDNDNEKEDEEMAEKFKYTEAKALPCLTETKSDVAVRDFIASIEGYYDELEDGAAGKIKLVNFVLKSKVQGAAKTKIGDAVVKNLEELKNLLLVKCGSVETRTTLAQQLQQIKQGSRPVEKYAEEISAIGERMAAIEIKDGAAKAEVDKIFEAQILGAFKRGLRPELQSAVCAARPSKMVDAIQVATEIAAISNIGNEQSSQSFSILQTKVDECRKCGRKGHWAKDCRVRNVNRDANYNRFVGRNNSNGNYRNQNQRNYNYLNNGNNQANFRNNTQNFRNQTQNFRNNRNNTQNFRNSTQNFGNNNQGYNNYQNQQVLAMGGEQALGFHRGLEHAQNTQMYLQHTPQNLSMMGSQPQQPIMQTHQNQQMLPIAEFTASM